VAALSRRLLGISLIVATGASYAAPPTVTVSVQTSDSSGGTLSYKWKVTDGTINRVNAASTTWTMPAGPGLHFAYVLVDNGLGGVTERRIAVSTDTIGIKATIPAAKTLLAPPQAALTGDFYRVFTVDPFGFGEPGVRAFIQDTGTGTLYPATGSVTSSARGDIPFARVATGSGFGTGFTVNCSIDAGKTFTDCTGFLNTGPQLADPVTGAPAATSWYIGSALTSQVSYFGTLQLADGSACGIQNEFFGVHESGTATLLNASGTAIGTYTVSENGSFNIPFKKAATKVRLNCAGASPIVVTLNRSGGYIGASVVAGVTAPTVQGMTAKLNNVVLNNVVQTFGTPEAIFLPPPSGLPSDILSRSDAYLAEKGLDTIKGACQYYKAVGAVTGCTTAGALQGAISFEDWKRTVQIDNHAVPGTTQYSAAFINQVDLNLMRVHQSISYGTNQTAAYVCNHLGPKFQFVTPQSDIDTAINNGVNGKNLVACVAMDYGITSGVNGDQPFTRFLIFGPSGKLLPSINLDGRREKYVPGTCVACHGGGNYAGKFPEDGSGPANVGAHFLPYDAGNFEFSSATSLTDAAQEDAIHHLNLNVLSAGPTPAEQDLITGWYLNGLPLNQVYMPPTWAAASNLDGTGVTADFYVHFLARSCRSCHVALREEYNFDHYANATTANNLLASPSSDIRWNICGGSTDLYRNYMMPNSLVTFNRLWLTYQNTAGAVDQIGAVQDFYGQLEGSPVACGPLGSQ
jgi:hypothetical protein